MVTAFLFVHGGNLAVCDHGAIDMSRLTDKMAIAPGSGILTTSLISDAGYNEWLVAWLDIILRGLDEKDTIIIGCSCSNNSPSSNAIVNALNKHCVTIPTYLITAEQKGDEKDKYVKEIVTHADYYHTSEVLTLMLFYQLIYSYTDGKYPPKIKK